MDPTTLTSCFGRSTCPIVTEPDLSQEEKIRVTCLHRAKADAGSKALDKRTESTVRRDVQVESAQGSEGELDVTLNCAGRSTAINLQSTGGIRMKAWFSLVASASSAKKHALDGSTTTRPPATT